MALSMILMALPAAAVAGYDSNYFGESAFVNITPGGTNQFAVGFTNTGATGWQVGSSSQVDLATCGVTQNTSDCVLGATPVNSSWASGWLSSNAYSTTTTNYVGPGQVGWFTYTIQAPSGASAGNYDFPGDLVLHNTTTTLRRQGYYQRASISAIGAVAKLSCTVSPGSIETGSPQTTTITVTVQDTSGNTVTSDNGRSITIAQAGFTPSGGLVSSGGAGTNTTISSTGTFGASTYPATTSTTHTNSATASTVNGVVTYTLGSDQYTSNGQDQLSAASSGLTGCLTTMTFTAPGAPQSLAVNLGGSAFPAGPTTTTTVSATTKDAAGVSVNVTSDTVVTFTVNDSSICNFSLGGGGTTNTAQATIPAGSSTTPTLTMNITGTAGTCTVTVSASGLATGTKSATIASSGAPSKIGVVSNNSPQSIGSPVSVTIQIQDSTGAPVYFTTADAGTVSTTATPSSCTNTTAPLPTTVIGATGTNGQSTETFTSNVAESCTETFTVSGTRFGTPFAVTGGATTVTWTGFSTNTAAYKLGGANGATSITFAPSSIAANGVASSTATVCVQDAFGNTVTTGTDSISLFKQGTSTDVTTTIVSTNPQTATSGCATFTIKAGTTAGTNDFQAQDNSRIVPAATGTLTTTTP